MMTLILMQAGPRPDQILTFLLKHSFLLHSQSLEAGLLEGGLGGNLEVYYLVILESLHIHSGIQAVVSRKSSD
jgi:hypothetical protein